MLEKKNIQFIIDEVQVQNCGFKEAETDNKYYQQKLCINTKPFLFENSEISQLIVYTNAIIKFEDTYFNNYSSKEHLKKYFWEFYWWQDKRQQDYFPEAKINKEERKIILQAEHLEFCKFRVSLKSLTALRPTARAKENRKAGRLEVKIKPIKITDKKIEINQLDFCILKFYDSNLQKSINNNFRPGKSVDIFFNEENTTSLLIELEKGQSKLIIYPFHLKNDFGDLSWFNSTTIDKDYYLTNKKVSIYFIVIVVITFIFLYLSKKKKKDAR